MSDPIDIHPRDVARYMAELEREIASDEALAVRMVAKMQADHDAEGDLWRTIGKQSEELERVRGWANRTCDELAWWRGCALVGWGVAAALVVAYYCARWSR